MAQLQNNGIGWLAEQDDPFKSLVESAPDAVLIIDDLGRIQMANRQTEKWFGYTAQELIGHPVEILIPTEARVNHIHLRDQYIRRPNLRPMGFGLELFGQRKDGTRFPVEISLSPIVVNKESFVTAIVRDITARKKLEKEREQIAERYRQLVEYLPVGVFRAESDHYSNFCEVNTVMQELFAAGDKQALRNLSLADLFADPAAWQLFRNELESHGVCRNFDTCMKRLDETEFYASISSVERPGLAGERIFEGVIKDVTASRENEQEIRRLNDNLRTRSDELEVINQELEAFSYSVSHDLRAPLRALDGFSKTLVRDYQAVLDERGCDRLDRIRAAAQRMSRLIDDLLNLSRVSRSVMQARWVDLSQMAHDVVQDITSLDPDRTVDVTIHPDLRVYADPQLMQIVLNNLVGNAWKFTGQRPVADIEIGSLQQDQATVFFVRDNGAGFDMQYADKLFGAFQRLHSDTEFSGTGIGLATVQRVIHKHGGRIWADSQPGTGATFFFHIEGEETDE